MNCDQLRPLLSAYVDRELDLGTSLEVERHLRSCDACRAALQGQEALRAALSTSAPYFRPPAALEERLRRSVPREGGVRAWAMPRWLSWTPAPLAAALALMLVWVVLGQRTGDNLAASELVSGHVRSLMVDHLVDVASSDQHTVKPWFNGKIDFSPPVADFAASGFPLIGGRVDYIGGRPVAALVYGRRQHVVNVFVRPALADDARGPSALAVDGYHLRRWQESGLTFWAVSDAGEEDLKTVEALFEKG